MNEMKEVTWNEFKIAIDKLIALEHGNTVYCWLRRRAAAHYEHTHEGYEELGSSDVTCHLFELWKQYVHSGRNPRQVMNDGFGFWINGEIADIIGVPNVKAVREYLSVENGY